MLSLDRAQRTSVEEVAAWSRGTETTVKICFVRTAQTLRAAANFLSTREIKLCEVTTGQLKVLSHITFIKIDVLTYREHIDLYTLRASLVYTIQKHAVEEG